MRYYKFVLADENEDDKNTGAEIPADDGHQMSQAEIDALIAQLLNN